MQDDNGHNGDDGKTGNSTASGNGEHPENIIRLSDIKRQTKTQPNTQTGTHHDTRRMRMQVTMGGQKTPIHPVHPPLINLPPFTKWLTLVLLLIHAITYMVLNPVQQYALIENFGFIPAYYAGAIPFGWGAVAGPFTYAFLHGSWGHLFINRVMMVAFGAGLERWMGWRRMAVFMLACSLAAAIVQGVIDINSTNPVIGASGAISGMFAAAMIMLQQKGRTAIDGKFSLMPFILIWIGTSVLFGMMGGPSGESIAWPAHIGGFLAGFLLIKPILKLKI